MRLYLLLFARGGEEGDLAARQVQGPHPAAKTHAGALHALSPRRPDVEYGKGDGRDPANSALGLQSVAPAVSASPPFAHAVEMIIVRTPSDFDPHAYACICMHFVLALPLLFGINDLFIYLGSVR